ncbi:dihydrofolate reductase [Lysobacter sp. A3-1-A15]|uniref:dihydrofolate reductase n=1 Tax=Novilysobacter viscosus TaxID=3098602 RepID=UPI003982E553
MSAPLPALVLVAALDRNGAIGRDNELPWRLPDDLKRFKALTLGKPVLMGRRTAESLGRALPGRSNLVLTRSGVVPFPGMQPVASLEEARELARGLRAPELCVIGGGEVYALTLPAAHRLRLTYVDTQVEGADAFFPPFDATRWRVTHREAHAADARHEFAFEFVDYASLAGGGD